MSEIDGDTFLDRFEGRELPVFAIGCHAGYSDPDSLASLYMDSRGQCGVFQGYSVDNGWGGIKDSLIDQALVTPDGPTKATLYQQLQEIYYDDCPSYPLTSPRWRRFCWYWVKGWYYNALFPSDYYYCMWKEDTCWYDISGTTPGISDGTANMKDVAYLILHFNTKAPMPGKPIDPKWVGTYGCGGVDPYGDRSGSIKDTAGCVQHFNHKQNTNTP